MAFSEEEILEFKTEASELLDEAEKSLLALEKGADLASQYDAIFRAFHSIKGAAGMMEMTALQEHMHQLENLFTEQKGKPALAKPLTDLFLRGADAARTLLGGGSEKFDYQVAQVKPALRAPAAVPVPIEKAPKPTQGKVLILDDELDMAETLGLILSDAGFETLVFTDPGRALAALPEVQPDVVLSDIAMPQMTGEEFHEGFRARLPDLPVIFVSGHVTKETVLGAIERGAYLVIEKPFDPKRIVAASIQAAKKHRILKLLNSSINLLLYQFTDLDNFLKAQGKEDVRKVISRELGVLLEQRRRLRDLSSVQSPTLDRPTLDQRSS